MKIYIVTKSNASNTEKHIIRAFTDKAKAHAYCEAQRVPALYDYEATELEGIYEYSGLDELDICNVIF